MKNIDSTLPPTALHMRLIVPTPLDSAEFHELSRSWLEASVTTLAGDRIAALEAAPPLPTNSLTRHVGSVGEPGTLWGGLEIEPENLRRSGPLYAWSPRAWRRFLDRHLTDRPRGANVLFTALNEYGSPGAGELLEFDVSYGILGNHWTSLYAHWQPLIDGAYEWESVAQTWAKFYVAFVDQLPTAPAFGCVADDMNFDPRTPLELALRLLSGANLAAGRLRGYSWITTFSANILELVGGAPALARSGAFHSVHEHPNGAVSVQATERLRDYDETAYRRVFEALAPALPSGTPILNNVTRAKLVYLDAADFGARP